MFILCSAAHDAALFGQCAGQVRIDWSTLHSTASSCCAPSDVLRASPAAVRGSFESSVPNAAVGATCTRIERFSATDAFAVGSSTASEAERSKNTVRC